MSLDVLDNYLHRAMGLSGVRTVPLELPGDFVDVAARFAHLPGTVVLLSGGDLDCSRYHLLGIWPWLTLSGRGGQTSLTIDDRHLQTGTDAFAVLRSIHDHFSLPPDMELPQPMAAGLMGYLAYDLKDRLEHLPKTSVDDLHLPDMLLFAPSVLVVHDKHTGDTHLMAPVRTGGGESAETRIQRFLTMMAEPEQPCPAFVTDGGRLQSNFTREAYEKAVQQVIDYIAAGDVYQVNLSQRFRVPFSGSAFDLFQHLFRRNPAPFFAFVQGGDHQVVSTSPERFLMQSGNRVETRPIKGTRPRGDTSDEDRAMREALLNSAKDGAELAMIVDLLRNDIGRVCAAGSVRVAEHKRLEAYQNVYHLVSIVEGELDKDNNSVDLIEATFPGGSITGCPKVRAMEIIDELESCRRHVYCGSIGYISFHRTMDLSIAIRTATIVDDTLFFSVGGGIVFDSQSREEYEETLHKGRTLMAACRREPAQQARESIVWLNGRLRAGHDAAVPVNDQGLQYGFGFFETLRVDKGQVPLLQDHLARLVRTWMTLMPGPLPDVTWQTVIDQVIEANGLQDGCAAVKILATRGQRTRAPWDHGLVVSARPYTHRLKAIGRQGIALGTYPHPRQSPLAGYKTLNYLYYLKAGQWAARNGFDEALIRDPDGSVSETNTANLLLIDGREVICPQSSGALPGVMAQAACRCLESWGYRILHRPVFPDELPVAGQLMATNALMGCVPVIAVDQNTRPEGGDLWSRLNDALIPGWREPGL